jgi:hypothetical protein
VLIYLVENAWAENVGTTDENVMAVGDGRTPSRVFLYGAYAPSLMHDTTIYFFNSFFLPLSVFTSCVSAHDHDRGTIVEIALGTHLPCTTCVSFVGVPQHTY